MGQFLKRLSLVLLLLLGLLLLLVWLVLSSNLFSGVRAGLVERVLQREIGQEISVNGGVDLRLGRNIAVRAESIALHSDSSDEVARVGSLEFNASLADLVHGQLRLSDVTLSGTELTIVANENGQVAGFSSPPSSSTETKDAAGQENVLAFFSEVLSDHQFVLRDSSLSYRSLKNGFEFDLIFDTMTAQQDTKTNSVDLSGTGSLNGEAFSLSGAFAPEQPATAQLAFESMTLDLLATPEPGGVKNGIVATAKADVTRLEQLQDVLRLNHVLDGTATGNAEVILRDGRMFVGNAALDFLFAGGQSISVKRTLGPSGGPADAVLDTTIRLFPEEGEPQPTAIRRDLKLVSVYMQLANRIDDVPLRKMVIRTNGFTLDTSGVGEPPITVSDISRSEDGKLRLGEVTLRLGPPEAPFVVLQGALNDALVLEQLDAHADLSLPLASLMAPELFQTSDILGVIEGEFLLSGSKDQLMLSGLDAAVQHTDLWTFAIQGSVGDLLTLNDIGVSLDTAAEEGSAILEAMQLKPVSTGPLRIKADLSSEAADWRALASLRLSDSDLSVDVTLDAQEPSPVVRGTIGSNVIKIDDLRAIAAAALEIRRLGEIEDQATEAATEELGPFRDVTLLPLGRSVLLSGMDLDIDVDLKKVEGKAGTSSLTSEVRLDGSEARIGPVEFSYGGGHFHLTGLVDLDNTPEVLTINGSTGGWDLGKIIQGLNLKKGVGGVLYANLEVSGAHTSVRDFMKSAKGWANISMQKGFIETQLLDIAGLGILPWLFSNGKGDRAPIVCLSAPLKISNGRVTLDKVVTETDQVQLIVLGDVDLGAKSMDIHGQPRKIGKPLSRSPWPFSLSGPFSDPKLKLKDGPRKLARKDGATEMPEQRKPCVPDIYQLQ